MKHFTVIIFLFFGIYSNLFSQIFWDEIPTGISVQLNCVSNVSGQVAWACGQNGTVIRTSNYGYNWVNSSGNLPNTITLVSISAVDASTALAAGYIDTNTFVYRSSNGGVNWTLVFNQQGGYINTVWMVPVTFVYLLGDPVGGRWSIWRSTNIGVNWDSTGYYLPQSGSETSWNNSFWYFGGKMWFGTNNSKIYHSINSGINWSSFSTPGLTDIYTISFDTNTYNNTGGGYAGGISLMKSTNTGQNWSAVTIPGSGNITGAVKTLWFPTGSWVTRGNSVYYSNNFGANWSTQFTSSSGTYTHLAKHKSPGFFTGPGFMYAAKTNGGISRANLIVEGVTLISGEVANNFTLNQNYPNPFNPATKITFSLPKLQSIHAGDVRGAFVSLRVYNTLGMEVAVLHDKIIQPGTYSAEWNASNMPSGIYYYSMIINDPGSNRLVFKETRKMVLIK